MIVYEDVMKKYILMILALSNMAWGASLHGEAEVPSFLWKVICQKDGGGVVTNYVFGTCHAIPLDELPQPLLTAVSDAMDSANTFVFEYDGSIVVDDEVFPRVENALRNDGSSLTVGPGDNEGWHKLMRDDSLRSYVIKSLNSWMDEIPSVHGQTHLYDPMAFRKVLEYQMHSKRPGFVPMDEEIKVKFRDRSTLFLETDQSRREAAEKAIHKFRTEECPHGVDTLEENIKWLEDFFETFKNTQKMPEAKELRTVLDNYLAGNIPVPNDAFGDFRNQGWHQPAAPGKKNRREHQN